MSVAIVPWTDTPPNRARHSAKVLELMAAGLPIVAYAVGELPVTLGEAGVLVPPGDADGFAAAVAALLADPDRAARLGAVAQTRVKSVFAWEPTCRYVLWQRIRRRAAHESSQDPYLFPYLLVYLSTHQPMKILRKNRPLRWTAVVAWMGLIFYLSVQPRLAIVMPLGLPQIQDVIGHFTVYAVLAVFLWWALRGAGVRHPLLWVLVATVLYSLTDEFHQSFVPNRHPDPFDLATDLAGAVGRW